MRGRFVLIFAGSVLAGAAWAQTSTSFELSEHVFNSGGHPANGQPVQSASFRLSLGSIGDGPAPIALSSASFRSDAGFVGVYGPPAEVFGLRFDDAQTLSWDGVRTAQVYNLYRDPIGSLSGSDFGSCEATEIAGSTTTDPDVPAVADGYFYLVTAINRLDEEGTKGTESDGSPREGTFCP